jgi:hypothetical protein
LTRRQQAEGATLRELAASYNVEAPTLARLGSL